MKIEGLRIGNADVRESRWLSAVLAVPRIPRDSCNVFQRRLYVPGVRDRSRSF
jgi:hypothetical protein